MYVLVSIKGIKVHYIHKYVEVDGKNELGMDWVFHAYLPSAFNDEVNMCG